MKKLALLLILLSFFPLIFADELHNSTLFVSAKLKEPIAKIRISPSFIDFGEITRGYETDVKNITITNIGTMDLRIKPVLSSGSDEIFKNVRFSSASCSSFSSYESFSSAIIDKPKKYEEVGESYNICLKLDLKSYKEEIPFERNASGSIVFWVIPAT